MGGNIADIEVVESLICEYKSLLDEITGDTNSLLKNNRKKLNLNFFSHDEPKFDGDKISKWKHCYEEYFKELDINITPDDLEIFSPYGSFKSIKDINHPLIEYLIEYKPLMVSFHFGLPDVKIIDYLIDNGISVFVSVTNPLEFQYVREKYKNIKGFILQNYDAGGHRGNFVANDPNDSKLNLKELIMEINKINESRDLHIILAGGIVIEEQIDEIFSNKGDVLFSNVSGIQLGTAFFLDDSVNLSPTLKQQLLLRDNDIPNTIVTSSISGRNLRALETSFISRLIKDSENLGTPDYPLPYSIYKNLASKDKVKYGTTLIGSNTNGLVNANGDETIKQLFAAGFEPTI